MKLGWLLLSLLFAASGPLYAGVIVSSPANGTSVLSPVSYAAGGTTTTCASGIGSMGIYVNSVLAYKVNGSALKTGLTLSPGSYRTTVKAWDRCGGSTSQAVNITVTPGTSIPNGVIMTSPVNSSTVSSPVPFSAIAGSPSCAKGIATMGIYVSGVLQYVSKGATLSTQLNLAAGPEHATIKAWTNCNTILSTAVAFTVQSAVAPSVSLVANPASVAPGGTSTLTATATNATSLVVTGSDGSSANLPSTGAALTVTPRVTTTYTATATGTGGRANSVASVTVLPVSPTVSMVATPASIAAGSSSLLTVTALNATQVALSGSDGSNFVVPSTGGTQTVTPTATTTYTVVASSSAGSATAATTVTVAASAPTIALLARPATITAGSSTFLVATAKNAAAVTLTGSDGSSYPMPADGGTQSVSPASTTTYVATATRAGASVSSSATVTVNPPAVGVTLTGNPSAITVGSSTVLTVTATYATAVSLTGSDGSNYPISASGGTQTVSPAATTTYTATATGSDGKVTAVTTITVSPIKPTLSLSATPSVINTGSTSVLAIVATNATSVSVAGSDNTNYSLSASGGSITVNPSSTTTYTATAANAGGDTTSSAVVTVAPSTLAVNPGSPSFTQGTTLQFKALVNNADGSTTDVTQSATWSVANSSVASITSGGLATGSNVGQSSVTATWNGINASTPFLVTVDPNVAVNIPTFHVDTNRSGLNSGETSLSPANVTPQTFGKLYSFSTDGYAYAEPLLMSNVTINGAQHNVLYVATENDSVYAFDADRFNGGTPLWQVSLLKSGEKPESATIQPVQGVTSTPVIDPSTSTIYIVSAQLTGSVPSFRLNALDIQTGRHKFGSPVTINASVLGTAPTSVNGFISLPTKCVQRAALLLANNTIYMGFGNCASGWLLAYDATALTQTSVFNASPNIPGEGAYASAGGIWMGAGGPAADGAGNIYAVTGNGPWDGQTAWGDSVLKFDSQLNILDYFTPSAYQFMNCSDEDLGSGGTILIPGASELIAGGKMGLFHVLSTEDLGQEQDSDAGALQEINFDADLSPPFSKTCMDSAGTHTAVASPYEFFGTPAYFNGSLYAGITPTSSGSPGIVRQFALSGTLTPGGYTSQFTQQNTRAATPFVSANGTSHGVVWVLDQGQPLQGAGTPSRATLRAFDANDLTNALYNSSAAPVDYAGYGIKFTSPVVANGKVYISTGHDLTTVSSPKGEIDVYGLN